MQGLSSQVQKYGDFRHLHIFKVIQVIHTILIKLRFLSTLIKYNSFSTIKYSGRPTRFYVLTLN